MATAKNSGSSKDNNNSSKQGFAAMDKDKQKEVASKGGKSHGSANKSK